jgi:protein SCO1/2
MMLYSSPAGLSSFFAMSNTISRPVRVFAWGLLCLALAAVVALFVRSQMTRSPLPRLGQIQPFTLTNQLGETFSSRELRGRVWVADIVFTRCAGPCPRMTEEMSKLQNAFSPRDPLRFVTLTTDPEYDTPPVLRRYGDKFGADAARWQFLTGSKAALKDVAIGSLKLAAVEKDAAERENPNDLFIHSTIFVLVDKNGAMRGIYESLETGFQEKIRADIAGLLRENG